MQQRAFFCTPRLTVSFLTNESRGRFAILLGDDEGVFMTDQSHRGRPNTHATVSENQIVFVIDLAGNFKFVNTAAECVSGYSREEACRMNVSQVVAPELKDYVGRQIREALQGKFAAVYEIEIITKDCRRVT